MRNLYYSKYRQCNRVRIDNFKSGLAGLRPYIQAYNRFGYTLDLSGKSLRYPHALVATSGLTNQDYGMGRHGDSAEQ